MLLQGEEGMLVKPVWKSSFMQTKGNFTAVEVALCPEYGFNYILPECIAKYQATGDKRIPHVLYEVCVFN